MLKHIAILMGFQLAGEAIVTGLGLAFPGPLCGLLLLLGWLRLNGGASQELAATSATLIDHLGLLFVPAGAAIVTFGSLLLADGVAIAAAMVVSTILAILVSGRIALSTVANTSDQAL